MDNNFSFEIKISKTKLPVPLINGIHLHSIYNPIKEAESFALQNENLLSQSKIFLLFGLGFAYHLDQIEFKLKGFYGEDYSIYIIEPNANIYQECLSRGFFKPSSKIKVFCRESIDYYFRDLDLLYFMVQKPAIIYHPASLSIYESFFKKFMVYKAPFDMDSISSFVENRDLREYFVKKYGPLEIDQILDSFVNKKITLGFRDHLLLSLGEISKQTS